MTWTRRRLPNIEVAFIFSFNGLKMFFGQHFAQQRFDLRALCLFICAMSVVNILLIAKNKTIVCKFDKNIRSCWVRTQGNNENGPNRSKDTHITQHRLATLLFSKSYNLQQIHQQKFGRILCIFQYLQKSWNNFPTSPKSKLFFFFFFSDTNALLRTLFRLLCSVAVKNREFS